MSDCRGPIDQDDEIPRVHVHCVGDEEPECVQYIEHGIEEEGVSWLVKFGFDSDSVEVAYDAALESALKVGVSVYESRIVVHHKELADDSPVFDVSEVDSDVARKLGANSARLAKGTPLKTVG